MNRKFKAWSRIVLVLSIAVAFGVMLGAKFRPANGRGTGLVDSAMEKIHAGFSNGKALTKAKTVTKSASNHLGDQLERDLALSSGVARWLYWMDAIEKASLEDFPRLARLAAGDSKAVKLVAARWIELNPKQMFETLLADRSGVLPVNELAGVLFDEWVKLDPQAVVAAMSNSKASGLFSNWRYQIAHRILQQDVEAGLKVFSDWHIENFRPHLPTVEKWAAPNPQHAAEFALAHPAGHGTLSAMEVIGKVWAGTDPMAALNFASAQTSMFAEPLAAAALKAWAQSRPREAGAWLASNDTPNRNRLSIMFAEGWAKSDPERALEWSAENLRGTVFADAAAAVARSAAQANVREAARLVADLPPSIARQQAAVAVAEKWLPSTYTNAGEVKPEAVSWLATLDAAAQAKVIDHLQWNWAGADPNSFAEVILKLDDRLPVSSYRSLGQAFARSNPTKGMDWAGKLPTQSRLGAASQIFQEWSRSQPGNALAWFRELPREDPRRSPLFAGFISALAYDENAAAKIELLNPVERAAGEKFLPNLSLPEAQRKMVLSALRTPVN